jgi:hypothetical protein
MVKDVYSQDEDQLLGDRRAVLAHVQFLVETESEARALVRVADTIAVSNRAPVSGRVAAKDLGGLVITIELRDCPATVAENIRRKLEQLTCVIRAEVILLVSERSENDESTCQSLPR